MLDLDDRETYKGGPHLAHLWWATPTFLGTGLILTAKFIYYEVTHGLDRDITYELMLALIASIFLGVGTIFLCITLDICLSSQYGVNCKKMLFRRS